MSTNAKATLVHRGRRVGVDGEATIGRDPGNDVSLADPKTSRRHACIYLTGKEWRIADMGSRNGTRINGDHMRSSERPLRSGDTIAIGNERLRFLVGEETRFADPTAAITDPGRVGFSGDRLRIGRDPTNDIVLTNPNVSRFHAEIVRDGAQFELRDLGSLNGTRLDHRLIDHAPLRPGAELRIGPFRLLFDGQAVLTRDDRGALRLDVDGVALDTHGHRLLHPTSFTVLPGEFVAVIGESGAGKSMLIKTLAGVTRPSEGRILVNGEPIATRLTDVGYVPQDEIVHPALTLREALGYSARLRLPRDTCPDEVAGTVNEVLAEVDLAQRADLRIGSLSGGQRKRAGLAAELLTRPSLLFLDEPTTGLDPGLESRMMQLMRELADASRAVVVVTHATKNLGVCDKLAVMGAGGDLCWFGPPADALRFFGARDFDEIYTTLDRDGAPRWRDRFRTEHHVRTEPTTSGHDAPPIDEPERPKRQRAIPQAAVLTARYLRLLSRDGRNLAILLGQVPVIALAIVGLFATDVLARTTGYPGDTAQMLFLLVTTAVWVGSIDSSREIIKERSVYARERAVGVRVGAYLASKLVVLFALVAVQVLILVAIVLGLRPLDESAATYLSLTAVLLGTGFVAVALGLAISAAVNSEDQATSLLPLVLIPQLLFAGAIVPVTQMGAIVKPISAAAFSQWSFAGVGTATDMNDRTTTNRQFASINRYGDAFFDLHLLPALGALAVFLVVFLAIALILLHQRRT